MCLYPSIHSLKFQRLGVTQEFSTAVQCLPINNEEQTRVSQELYPLCFSSRCPLLLTKSYLWALMVRFLLCHGYISVSMPGRNYWGKGVVPSRLQTSYRYFVHRYVCLASLGGFLCPPDLNRALPAVSNLAANLILEPLHHSGTAMLDLLAPVAPMANVPQQLLAVFLYSSSSSCVSAAGSYRNRNHSWRGSASSSGLACCRNNPCEPRRDR